MYQQPDRRDVKIATAHKGPNCKFCLYSAEEHAPAKTALKTNFRTELENQPQETRRLNASRTLLTNKDMKNRSEASKRSNGEKY